jgi:hypothetical protein
MRAIGILLLGALLVVAAHSGALAHTLFMNLDDNEDGTVLVEGMYSTGSMAVLTPVLVKDADGKVLWKGQTDESGQCEVPKQDVPYTIFLDAGPGHQVEETGPPKK